MERPEGFDFRPGQFLMIRVAAEGKDEVRCYSISSSPEAAGYLEISVRRQGRASGALHETIRAGGVLPIRGPGGDFVYPVEPDVVLHAGGVGVTDDLDAPARGEVGAGRPVTFLHREAEPDVAFRGVSPAARQGPRYVTLSRGEPKPDS
jgi:ferredoxin-NADP reductase